MSDTVVILTGASSGFGWHAAIEAARKGYRVVVTARRAERLDELVKLIEASGGTAVAVAGDVNDDAVQQRLVDTALERFGRIDALVNNAGVPLNGTFASASLDDLRRQWDTNTTSVIALTKRALPALEQSKGVVINISSGISRFSVPGMGLYAPSKVSASSITDALRRELVPLGVRVCLVEPGPYHTEFGLRAGGGSDQTFGFDPQVVSRAIVRLIERPKRLTVLPIWMRPLLAVLGSLTSALPGLVDVAFWAVARRQQRKQQADRPEIATA